MKVIVNRFIPFHGYVAMAFFNIILWRKEYESDMKNTYYYKKTVNHESIHEAQMRDFCKWIPIGGLIFYIIYLCEWIVRLFINQGQGYRNISFEKEAKENELNYDYLSTRPRFAMWKKKKPRQ